MAEGAVMSGRADDHAWRVRFGFWDELDVLYNSFAPSKRPRTPEQPRDSAAEWCAAAASYLLPGNEAQYFV